MAAAENRLHRRYDALNLISYFIYRDDGTPAKQGVGRTLNVSQGGLKIELRQSCCGSDSYRPSVGQELSVAIGLGDEMVEIKGRIVYVAVEENGPIVAGVAFGELPGEGRSVLKRYI